MSCFWSSEFSCVDRPIPVTRRWRSGASTSYKLWRWITPAQDLYQWNGLLTDLWLLIINELTIPSYSPSNLQLCVPFCHCYFHILWLVVTQVRNRSAGHFTSICPLRIVTSSLPWLVLNSLRSSADRSVSSVS